MIQFRCPSCRNTFKVDNAKAGKKAKCGCGAAIKIPGDVAGAQSPSPAQRQPQPHTAVAPAELTTCQACGTKLRMPAGSAGKLIKCRCGNTFRNEQGTAAAPAVAAVVSPSPSSKASSALDELSPTPAASSGESLWDDLPVAQTPAYQPARPAPVAQPRAVGAPARPGSHPQSKSAQANEYLARAHAEEREQRRRSVDQGKSDEPVFDGGMISGMVMMIVAVVWFFGGLLVGIIWFYPPILFVLGLITFIGGCFGGD